MWRDLKREEELIRRGFLMDKERWGRERGGGRGGRERGEGEGGEESGRGRREVGRVGNEVWWREGG